MKITIDTLVRLGVSQKNAALYVDPINKYIDEYKVNTLVRLSHFFSQILHESILLSASVENLNYSDEALVRTWPNRFYPGSEKVSIQVADGKTAEGGTIWKILPKPGRPAGQYARQSEKIANYVYANRLGNGDEASGDGWKFRGHGPMQVTGKEKAIRYSKLFGVDYVTHPEYLARPDDGIHTAFQFWKDMNLNAIADTDNPVKVTKTVNGGLNGYEDRVRLLKKAIVVLAPLFMPQPKTA